MFLFAEVYLSLLSERQKIPPFPAYPKGEDGEIGGTKDECTFDMWTKK
jgi:hypothetical protein